MHFGAAITGEPELSKKCQGPLLYMCTEYPGLYQYYVHVIAQYYVHVIAQYYVHVIAQYYVHVIAQFKHLGSSGMRDDFLQDILN